MMPLCTTATLPVASGAGGRCGRSAARASPSGCDPCRWSPPGERVRAPTSASSASRLSSGPALRSHRERPPSRRGRRPPPSRTRGTPVVADRPTRTTSGAAPADVSHDPAHGPQGRRPARGSCGCTTSRGVTTGRDGPAPIGSRAMASVIGGKALAPKAVVAELSRPGPYPVLRGELALVGLPGAVFTPRHGHRPAGRGLRARLAAAGLPLLRAAPAPRELGDRRRGPGHPAQPDRRRTVPSPTTCAPPSASAPACGWAAAPAAPP